MKTFSIHTLGCKVNQYESQQVRELLESFGLRKAKSPEKPDLAVINTCCVTHTASVKSRQQIRKIQKLQPEYIVVCGCLPVVENNSFIQKFNSAEQSTGQTENIIFITNRNELALILIQLVNRACSKHHFQSGASYNPGLVTQSINLIKPENCAEIKLKKGFSENPEMPSLTRFKGQTRAFLKVQDGCDGFCSYCIVPKTRLEIKSKPINEVLSEASALVQAGHKEIVIAGVCLGAYGKTTARRKKNIPEDDFLADLIEKIAQIPRLERIRLSSIEPLDITDRLLDVFRGYKNIMPHLHLSLQSGSDAVLKKMCRRYKIDEVRKKIDQIRAVFDNPAITTDIIVGFPGETDENFDETVKIVKETGFAKIHVFRFSSRKNTPASRMRDFIDSKIINRRSEIMLELDRQSGYDFRNKFIGKTETILIENTKQFSGRSERYFMVYLDTKDDSEPKFKKNDIVKVTLLKNTKDGMIGKPLEKK
jgi:threonylcarbamoyladenosine tRNA methylthiotransferase MtaB